MIFIETAFVFIDKKLARRKQLPVLNSEEDGAENEEDKIENIITSTSSLEDVKRSPNSSSDSDQTDEDSATEGSATEELSDIDGEENKENRLEAAVRRTAPKRRAGAHSF